MASFLSPCMLPVIPAFFAQLVGTSLGASSLGRRDVFLSAVLCVAGFSAVFTILGVALNAALQEAATEVLAWLPRFVGAVVIFLGLHLTGLVCIPFLDREYWISPKSLKPGYFTSSVFGACFAVAWTPCVGPILGSTLALATTKPASAFPLLLAYAFGLGTPFISEQGQ